MPDELTVIENPTPAPEKITSVKIDDGTRRIPFLNNDNEEIGVLRFRPADFGMVTRFNESREKWDEIGKTLEESDAEEDGAASIEKATKGVREVFDYILGGPVSAGIFRVINPFNPVGSDGEMFCEVVMDTVQKLIEQEFGEQLQRMERRQERMAKYRPNRQARRAGAK